MEEQIAILKVVLPKLGNFYVLKRQLPKVFFPIGHFPHVKFSKWLLPNVQFSKRQPKSFLAKELGSYPYLVAALDPLTYLNCSARGIRRPKLTFGKLSLEKSPLGKYNNNN